MGPNVYPPSCPSSSLQEPARKYYAALLSLSESLMRLIALTLAYGLDIFERFLDTDPAAPLCLGHYRPMPLRSQLDGQEECGTSQFGARRHTDIGAITILLQDSSPGLQVEHLRSPGTCLPVPPREDAFVINLGDMLSMWTRAGHRSSVRRVVSKPGGKERYSVVFFLDERLDCELGTLGGEGGEGKVLTVEEHMLERMASLYGRGIKLGARTAW